ncbi:MAG: GNAT family N-acetyltransferase [Flavicella sp.]
MTQSIRKSQIDDIPELSELFDAYRVFYKKRTNLEAAKVFLTERMQKMDSEIFVCENESKELLGFVQLYPSFSSTRLQKLWVLNDLFVAPKFRGKGISKQLIEKAKSLVIASEACAMVLETEKSNAVGNSLYPKTGFVLNTEANFYEWQP